MKYSLSLLIVVFTIGSVLAQKRVVDVSGFSELSFSVAGNLYLKQGSNEKVEVDCDDDIFEDLKFEIKGDRLVIKRENNWRWNSGFRKSDLDIYVTMQDIEKLSVSGSGSINGESQFETDDLVLSVSGSGDMELDLESNEVDIRISGSGTVRLEGTSDRISAKISGSGKVKAEDLTTKSFEASISGSGSCYITASDEVKANISGSGNVYYSGDPSKVISNSSGSGKIKKM
jgi:hypothetical protein